MKVVRNNVVMAALMALLAVKGNFADVSDAAMPKLWPAIAGPGMNPLLPMLPTINPTGQCPTYPSITLFQPANFAGAWFVYQQSHNILETGWTCKKMTYTTAGNVFTYSTRQFGLQLDYQGTFTVPNPAVGTISVQLQRPHVMGVDSLGRVNQFVVAGVATQYMIIRSCTFFPAVPGLLGFNIEYVHVLTRDAVPTTAVTTAIAAALNAVGINSAVLRLIPQTGC